MCERLGAGRCGVGALLAGDGAMLLPFPVGAFAEAAGGGAGLRLGMRGVSLFCLPMTTNELDGLALLVTADRGALGGVGVGGGVGLAGRSEPRVMIDGGLLPLAESRVRVPGRSSVPRARGDSLVGFAVGAGCRLGDSGLAGVAVSELAPRHSSCLAPPGMVGGREATLSRESPAIRGGRVSMRPAGVLPAGRCNSPLAGSLLTVAAGDVAASGI